MSDTLSVGLTRDDRELLLRGLRFVRSSVTLDICDPSPDVNNERRERLRVIDSLVRQLHE